MARVTFVDVTRRYGDDGPEAISALNLDIADGAFVVLVGPSGSGKGTALRMLAGFIGSPSMNFVTGDALAGTRLDEAAAAGAPAVPAAPVAPS
jgi:ABC-type bacteriocin/lantibiotic exporter with double-glycine peptidase domain